MSFEKDPLVQQLFASKSQPQPNDAFTASVMGNVQSFKKRRLFVIALISLVASLLAWLLSQPLLAFSLLLIEALNSPLVENDVPSIIAPINSMAAALVGAGFILYKLWRTIAR